jgi:NAD(P)-dependent dehydrogenase (short-subunit alcohol dehydrogenase family)
VTYKRSLKGKRVFLTGGAPADDPDKRTLGERFAEALRSEGAEVFLVDIKKSVRLFASDIGAVAFVADVTKLHEMEAAFQTAVHVMGGIDIVIANAGMADITTFENNPKSYERVRAVNETGVYNTIRAGMPYVKEPGKFVLVNASNGGIVPLFLMMAYNASKAHAIKLAEGCNLELKNTGARCGVLLLSEHASPMEDNFKRSLPRMLMDLNPLLKYGHKERGPQHAVNGMLRAVKGRRLYTSVPRYSVLARYFPAVVGWITRAMHRKIQPVADAAREQYEDERGIIFD